MRQLQKPEIIAVDLSNIDKMDFFCYMSRRKSEGYLRKLGWVKARLGEGMRIKMLKLPERSGFEPVDAAYGVFNIVHNGKLLGYHYLTKAHFLQALGQRL